MAVATRAVQLSARFGDRLERYAEPHEFVECSQCEALVHIDRAVGISIGDELFCSDSCLLDWVADNYDVVAKRIRD